MAQVKVPMVKGKDLRKIGPSLKYGAPDNFDLYSAGGAALDWSAGGALVGGILGCGIGAVLTLEAAGAGCALTSGEGALLGMRASAITGWFLGGYHNSHANDFDWSPDSVYKGGIGE